VKGLILAGGNGSRLYPLTKVTNKHLLPVYNKPMIYYALNTLAKSGIREIMIISGAGHAGHFLELLGSGNELGIQLSYAVQEKPRGIAQAIGLAERFANNDTVAVILGDNIFDQKFRFDDFREGARIFLKNVPDVYRFGMAKIDDGRIVEIVEKPKITVPGLAVTGLYLYDNSVFDIIKCLKPSSRGEFEITDVNNEYIKRKKLDYRIIESFWSDAGTFESLYRSTVFAREIAGDN